MFEVTVPSERGHERPASILVDAAIATAVTVASVVSVAVAAHDEGRDLPVVAYALIGCTGWPLAVRRIWPLCTWAAVTAATVAFGLSDWPDPPLYLGGLIALFTVASLASRSAAVWVGALTLALAILAWLADPAPTDLNDLLAPMLAGSTAWLAGFGAGLQRDRIALLRQRAARSEQERSAELGRVVAEERLRMARELHDVTAHHVTVMAVQAEAGLADPGSARASLAAVSSSGRAALADLRRMLGLLRGADPDGRQPQPGLDALPALVDQARSGDLCIDLTTTGEPVLGDGAELAAFRIAQEALTNVVRHSGAHRARVSVHVDPSAVEVTVVDDGRGPGSTLHQGNGLLGMRERVALYHGSLDVGPNHPSGLALRARLLR